MLRLKILKWLGLVPRSQYMRLYSEYVKLSMDIKRAIEIHGMQAAWQQAKDERKRQLH